MPNRSYTAKPVYHIEGARGRTIDIFPNKCVITVSVTLGSLFTKNTTDGEKTIFFSDVIGIQFKLPGLTLGYIQLETANSSQNNEQSNFFNENTFTFDGNHLTDSEAKQIRDYICTQVERIKTMSCFGINPSEEMKKYRKLFEDGAISEREYKELRKDILGLLGVLADADETGTNGPERTGFQGNFTMQQPVQQRNQPDLNSQYFRQFNRNGFDLSKFYEIIQRFSNAKEIYEYTEICSSQFPGIFNANVIDNLKKCANAEIMYGNKSYKGEGIQIINQYFGIK